MKAKREDCSWQVKKVVTFHYSGITIGSYLISFSFLFLATLSNTWT